MKKAMVCLSVLAAGILGYLLLFYSGWTGSENQIIASILLGLGVLTALVWTLTWDSMESDFTKYPFALYR